MALKNLLLFQLFFQGCEVLSPGFCWQHCPPSAYVLFPLGFLECSAQAFLVSRIFVQTCCLSVPDLNVLMQTLVPGHYSQQDLGMSQGSSMGEWHIFTQKVTSCLPVMSSTQKESWGMKLWFVRQGFAPHRD